MKRLFTILILLTICVISIIAQVVVNPVFDRTDAPSFRVLKVEITPDTTFVHCTLEVEESTWVNISRDTFLEEINGGEKLSILDVKGIPFAPQKMDIPENTKIEILLSFPNTKQPFFSIIEDEESEAFNIYGINLNKTYDHTFSYEDINEYRKAAVLNEEKGDWHSAIDFAIKQLAASKYVYGERSIPCSWALFNLSNDYYELKDYEKSIASAEKALDILLMSPLDSTNFNIVARTYANLGSAYKMLNQNDKANYFEELLQDIKNLYKNRDRIDYDQYLTYKSTTYYREGNYPKALLFGKELVDSYERKYKIEPYYYSCVLVNSLNNLCEFYQKMDKYNEAIKYGQRALKLVMEGVCSDNKRLKFAAFNNLAGALVWSGKSNEAKEKLEEVIKSLPKKNLEDTVLLISSKLQLTDITLFNNRDTVSAISEYKDILQSIESSNFELNMDLHLLYESVLERLYEINSPRNHIEAITYLKKAINVQENINHESILYGNLLLKYIENVWAESLMEKRGLDSLLIYMNQATSIIKRHIYNTSYSMPKEERVSYWGKYERLFTWLIPTICGMIETDKANELAYDAALFYKGLLLSSEEVFKKVILSSQDNMLIYYYKTYLDNLSKLEKQYTISAASEIIDSLKSVIQNEEYLLSQKVSKLNNLINKEYSWKDVQRNLKDKDVAIEIVSYKSLDKHNQFYDAYAITNKTTAPKLIKIASEADLLSCYAADSTDYVGLSSIIWGNEDLHDIIIDAENIFISVSGLFNTIGFEYLPIAGNRNICDRFNIYRLSSTKELCYPQEVIKNNNVYLYGGLDYNKAYYNIDNTPIADDSDTFVSHYRLADRGSFEQLYGSGQEVRLIRDEIKKKKGINCSVFSGAEGTEESIKRLSGRHVNTLHISTHGMFISSENNKVIGNNNFRFVIPDNIDVYDNETSSLSRSFLVMSGGNMLINRDTIPKSMDDGILTALEISHLDFQNLDLAVLSACQTALGITNSEGIYGLQRGFKKAGAKTILMSLDKVDDEATRILMVEFYRNLMDGQTKLQSLRNAQKYLRTVENGKYDDPKYWASFIMLDGLN